MHSGVPHVVYCFDSGYLACGLVSIYSVLKHAAGPVRVTVVGGDFEPKHSALIRELCGRFPKARVDVRGFDLSEFESVESGFGDGYMTASALIRLRIPWLVEGRAVYLDADTLVVRDIAGLYGSNLNGHPVGACLDTVLVISYAKRHSFRLSHIFRPARAGRMRRYFENAREALGGDFERTYFNSGVLVMDTDAIRSADEERELADAAKAVSKWGNLHDQDWLNYYFRRNVEYLDLKFNVIARSGRNLKYASPEIRPRIEASLADPSIIHYTGSPSRKPWNRKRYRRSRFDRLYLRVCEQMKAETGIPVLDMLRS